MAKKGSQLKRFKESLSSITRPGQNKRKRKQIPDRDPDRNDKLKRIEEQFNTFDTKFTKPKHEVFGRKIKGKTGKPAASKELGEESRKNALLKERQQRNRVGGVVDRRFGENDPDMDPEEKMLERFAREKQKRTRNSSLYNLEDDAQLTHFGQSLADIDDFNQEELLAVSDDDGDIKEDVVRQDHFGGNFDADSDEDPDRVKTKAEVMAEVMAKSKMYKHERQQQHEEDLDEIEALDADLGELQGLLRNIKPAPLDRPQKTQEMMSYDAALKEMVYDKRSKPTERTKTEDEIALEEVERLKTLEEERLKRMRGEDMDVEEGDKRQRGRREGDDLDDDFVPEDGEDDYYGLGKGALADIVEEQAEAESDASESDGEDGSEEEVSEDGDDAVSDGDQFDLAEYFTDEEETNGVNEPGSEPEDTIVPATKRLRLAEPSTTTEIAYTFPCPATLEEMLDILKDIPAQSIPTVIERIEILYSVRLLSVNREKLETLTRIVLQLVLHLASEETSFDIIKPVIVRLHKLATQFPAALTPEVFAAIEAGRKRMTQSKKAFPAAEDLVLFYTVGQIYPTSDLSHIVVNATTLFIGQILSQMKVKSLQDLGRGLFLCSVFLEYQKLAKRISPEVVNFINFALVQLIPVPADLPDTRSDTTSTLRLRPAELKGVDVMTQLSFLSLYAKDPNEAQLKLQVFTMTLELVDASSDLWKSIVAFPELFRQTHAILVSISKKKLLSSLPKAVQARLTEILDTLSRRMKLAQGTRVALTLQAHRPIPIPSYLPKFTMSYSFDSKNDPDHDRAGLSKLQAQHRREKKSIIRELRKEARTEAVVRSEEGKRRDQVYEEKMRVANGIMKGGNSGIGKWERDQSKRKRR